jgi:outer membrane protein OmpA-like peptidoglycan-associated protein
MTTDFRRHWQAALATLLIWCCAGLLGSIVQAADEKPAPLSDVESQALAERLDALIEQAAARVGKQGVQGGEPGTNVVALRQQLEAAETQIALLKNVVIQALRAQSAAEATLHRGQAAPQTAAPHEGAPETGGQGDLAVADQLAALTATVQSLQAEVHALRREVPPAQVAERDTESLARESSSEALAAPVEEEDAMLADSGMGGKYEPLLEDEPSGSDLSDPAATASGDAIQVAKVHFNSGSARLTPAGERKTLAAAERIRSMEPAKVRVVAFTDRVGDAAYNRVLSKERALSVAALLESVGLPRDMVEVVGSGEDGIPEPTPDGVPEPLNRCAGIFVVRDSTG